MNPPQIEAEVIAPVAVNLLVKSVKKESKVAIPATDSDTLFTPVPLGNIEMAAGLASFEIKVEKAGWKPVQIRKVTLNPVR